MIVRRIFPTRYDIYNLAKATISKLSGATSFGLGRLYLMAFYPTALERAFQLAQTGEFAGLGAVIDRLRAEGFSVIQIEGPLLRRQLRELCAASRAERQ